MKPKVIYTEDEESLALIVKESLEIKGFDVYHCNNGEDAIKLYHSIQPDILILDIMMPKTDGFTVAKEIRLVDADTPILFLSARTQTKDVVTGFNLGANDYIKKPFSIEELVVRMNALIGKTKKTAHYVPQKIGIYTFDYAKQEISLENHSISLTHRESELLYHLAKNKNKVLERSYTLKKIWGSDDFYSARSMDVFITKLRKKLKKDASIKIVNIRGVGYKLIC